ncbi:MAG TPA: phosphonate ABC transporter ATP-binding protein [Candidatus Dormibacteraeota bacterium]
MSLRYPTGTLALDSVSFQARPGELTVILGQNGSGKSTLVRCIVRLLRPTTGAIRVAGDDLVPLSGRRLRTARQQIAVIFQDASLVPRRTALANVAVGCLGRQRQPWTWIGGLPADERRGAFQQLERVGMSPLWEQRSDTLSGGQAQRVAIARALHQAPAVLLADEPVASLDPDATHEVMSLLQRLAREEGIVVVCVLHQLEVAREFADHLVGLRGGKVVIDQPAFQVTTEDLSSLYRAGA